MERNVTHDARIACDEHVYVTTKKNDYMIKYLTRKMADLQSEDQSVSSYQNKPSKISCGH